MGDRKLKMMLVVRGELNMRKGKIAAQCGHAAQEAILDRSGDKPQLKRDPLIHEWLANNYAKICVRVITEEELLELQARAEAAGINTHLVLDTGHTEFHGVPTRTVLALGPDYADVLDPLTSKLDLI